MNGCSGANGAGFTAHFQNSRPLQEYFQNFAQELREIVAAGIPNMIADNQPAEDIIPPPPPTKRPSQSGPPQPPRTPPPWIRETAALSALPPPLEKAEKIEVRVDQAFNDWANDFAMVVDLAASPSDEGTAPPPPPPKPKGVPPAKALGALPAPPPRPQLADQPKAAPPVPPMAASGSALRSAGQA